jgi:phosphate transport system protein
MTPPQGHTDRAFEQDLHTLRQKLLAMGGTVEERLAQAVRAITERDESLARHVEAHDAEIDRLELEIDELCRRILALRQPAASDLRLITTALKIVTDLERCGDLAVNIAERARDLASAPEMPPPADLPRLAELAQRQMSRALDAFVAGSDEQAEEVLSGDELLDALYLKIFNELLGLMMEDTRYIRRATCLMSIAKHLERVGDHAMNVAEMIIYMVRGTDVRHSHSRSKEG